MSPQPVLMDFDDDDLFSEEDEESWAMRVGSVLDSARKGHSGGREEAWQILAAWGERSPACRRHLALALLVDGVGAAMVSEALRVGVAISELYPMVAALRSAALGLEGRADAVLGKLDTTAHLPKLVARELHGVRRQLAA